MNEKYYFFVENNTLNGKGQCRILNESVINYEVGEEMYENYKRYKWDETTQSVVFNTNWEEEEKAKERAKINMLSLTSADVERVIYKDKGKDFNDIVELVKLNPSEGIDIKALKIELKANNFYRGNPYVEQIGKLLGYSSEDLDYLFQNKELPIKENKEDLATTEAKSDIEKE